MSRVIKDIKQLYLNRFPKNERQERERIWQILCNNFFQNYIDKESWVLDLGAGYCEFINNIKAKKKIAVDLNPETKKFADSFVKVYNVSSTHLPASLTEKINVVFASNFFEHLSSKEDVVRTLAESKRVLVKNGKIIILLPNIKYVGNQYWDFLDHQLPLSDKSIEEALMLSGFKILVKRSRFLPYSMKSRIPKASWMIKVYLKIRILQEIFGKQSLIVAQKTS